MPRKTMPVADLKAAANAALAYKGQWDKGPDYRQGVAGMLETALHATGNYKGFRYLDGWPCDDETRREYF